MKATDQIRDELYALQKQSTNGLLRPEQVIAWARENPESAIFKDIERHNGWNDQLAAEAYRVNLARNMIRLIITWNPQTKRRVRAMVSVPTDRVNGGGYRKTEDAIAHPQRRAALLQAAIEEIRRLPDRYGYLPELQPLFSEIQTAIDRYEVGMATVAESA